MYIGIDIGATKTDICLLNKELRVIKSFTEKTSRNRDIWLENIINILKKIIEKNKISVIGIACAGSVDVKTGVLLFSPNLKDWKSFNIKKEVEKEVGIKTCVDNDCNASAIAEYMLGKHKKKEPFIYLTISSGVGGALINNGRIYRGYKEFHQEMGHQHVYPVIKFGKKKKRYKCSCNSYNCLEALVSGWAIKKIYGMKPEKIKKKIVWKEIGTNLATGLYNICIMYAPSVIIIGGSIALGNGRIAIEFAKNYIKRRVRIVPPPIIDFSTIKYSACIGACIIALNYV